MVLSKSNGYDPTVAAQPANAPLMYERYGLKLMWSSEIIEDTNSTYATDQANGTKGNNSTYVSWVFSRKTK